MQRLKNHYFGKGMPNPTHAYGNQIYLVYKKIKYSLTNLFNWDLYIYIQKFKANLTCKNDFHNHALII